MTVLIFAPKKSKRRYKELLADTPHSIVGFEYSVPPDIYRLIRDKYNPHIVIFDCGVSSSEQNMFRLPTLRTILDLKDCILQRRNRSPYERNRKCPCRLRLFQYRIFD